MVTDLSLSVGEGQHKHPHNRFCDHMDMRREVIEEWRKRRYNRENNFWTGICRVYAKNRNKALQVNSLPSSYVNMLQKKRTTASRENQR